MAHEGVGRSIEKGAIMAPLVERLACRLLGDLVVQARATHITGNVVSTTAAQFQLKGGQVIHTTAATLIGVAVGQAWGGARQAWCVIGATALRHMACGVIATVAHMTRGIIGTTRLTNMTRRIVRTPRLVAG